MAQAARIKISLDPFLIERAQALRAYAGDKTPFSRFVVRLFAERLDQIDTELAGIDPFQPNEPDEPK